MGSRGSWRGLVFCRAQGSVLGTVYSAAVWGVGEGEGEAHDLSSRNLGSHWSPGSGMFCGRATCACCAAVRPAASGRSECCWSGIGGAGRGEFDVVGVLIRETSWLPGFGGGAGGVFE